MTGNRTVIDCSVHHGWTSRAELLRFLDPGWVEFATSGEPNAILPYTARGRFSNPADPYRADSYPPNGTTPGTDLPFTIAAHVEASDIGAAILTHGEGLWIDTNPNPYYAAAIARAANDWLVAEALPYDERLFGSIVISNQHPELASEEIRRMAAEPRMKQILLADNGIGKPFGHPLFDPIHKAAEAAGLPLAIHAPSVGGMTPAAAAQGTINYFVDHYALISEGFMTHLTSFVTHGVFERYPGLKLVFLESGATWIAPFLWRLDANYKGLRREIPWARRMPTEYFREHVRVSISPLDAGPDPEGWLSLLESLGGASMLVYGSGYPQWDSASVADVSAALPPEWLESVLEKNASEWFGICLPKEAAAP